MSSSTGSHLCVLCNNHLESKDALREHFRKHANNLIDNKGNPKEEGASKVSPDNSKPSTKGIRSRTAGHVVCEVCGENFNCNTAAIMHKFRKHPDKNLNYFCPQCGMQFPLKMHRDKHISSEHGTLKEPELRFECHMCQAVFYNSVAHQFHTKSTHQRILTLFTPVATAPPSKCIRLNNAQDPQSAYYCHLCGLEYIVKFNLQRHIEKQHTVTEQNSPPDDLVKCTTCDALFYHQKAYTNHLMFHKPSDVYVTSEAQRLRLVTRVDQDFDIRRVQSSVDKYIPSYQKRQSHKQVPVATKKKKKVAEEEEEMSPPSDWDSTDSESDIPLVKLKSQQNLNASGFKHDSQQDEQKPLVKCEFQLDLDSSNDL